MIVNSTMIGASAGTLERNPRSSSAAALLRPSARLDLAGEVVAKSQAQDHGVSCPIVDAQAEDAWTRAESVAILEDLGAALLQGKSQRAFAAETGVPRTTLQHWLTRKHELAASPALVGFFESSVGLAFLHRLVIALQFVLTSVAGAGIRPVVEIIRLAGIEPFVANSIGSQHDLNTELVNAIRAYASEQQPWLARELKPKRITVCEDETFHPEICLVAVEPVSNFILLEEYAEKRDAQTWDDRLGQALKTLPVRVIQSTSDEGKGLLGHVKNGLDAHHSPDVFHVQQELSRSTSIALASQVKQAEEASAKTAAETEEHRHAAQAWAHETHGPGRPPSFNDRIVQAQAAEEKAQQGLDATRKRQERARRAVRGISQDYHPVDLKTGTRRTTDQVTKDLERHFAEIKAVAEEAKLPERCRRGINKAHRVRPGLSNTMTFFCREVEALVQAHALAPDEANVVENFLLPVAYLARAASKASDADARAEIRSVAARLQSEAEVMCSGLSFERHALLERLAQDCADIFQRSSSCVEGRNGQLALRHHSLHDISAARLESLTVVHNYFIRRSDGTTPAERFFGTKPDDLFDWLLDHLDMPARPAMKRPWDLAQLN